MSTILKRESAICADDLVAILQRQLPTRMSTGRSLNDRGAAKA